MGKEGREALKELYRTTSRDSFEIVHYWIEPGNLATLKKEAGKYAFNYPIVSDFLSRRNPNKDNIRLSEHAYILFL